MYFYSRGWVRDSCVVSGVSYLSIYLRCSSSARYGIESLISERMHVPVGLLKSSLSQCGEQFVRLNSNTNLLVLVNPFLRILRVRTL